MVMYEYEIHNNKKHTGTWLSEKEFIELIKVTEKRKPKLHKTLIRLWEILEGEKFDKKKHYYKD